MLDVSSKRKELKRQMTDAEIAGISVTTFHLNDDNKPVIPPSFVQGVTNDKENSAVTQETRFGAASLSKPVFAYLVLKLAQDPAVDFNLDTPLHTIFADERFSDHPYHELLTPRLILSHQSGLPTNAMDSDEAIDFLFEPGTKYGYSGVGISYLQKAIEKKTDQGLEELAKKYVFSDEAIGMKHSTFNPPDGTPAHAERSLFTTGEDYAKFMAACLNEPEMFENIASLDGGRDDWATNQGFSDTDLKKIGWGLGWGLQKTLDGKVTCAFHSGDMNNWRTFVAIDKDAKKGVVYFSNSSNGLMLADRFISPKVDPNIDLEDGLNYVFKKFGFTRTYEAGFQEKERARVMKIRGKNEPNVWKFILEEIAVKPTSKWAQNEEKMKTQVRDEIIKAIWEQVGTGLEIEQRIKAFENMKVVLGMLKEDKIHNRYIPTTASYVLDRGLRENDFDTFKRAFSNCTNDELIVVKNAEKLSLDPIDKANPHITAQDIEALQEYMDEKNISASVIISNDEESYPAGIASDVPFAIHSVGKVFTGILVMKMIREGYLSEKDLDRPLDLDEEILSKLSEEVKEKLKSCTLRDLMLHQSGLGDYLDNEEGLSQAIESALNRGDEPPKVMSSNDLLKYADKKVTDPKYSNLGILLVGFALEKKYNNDERNKGKTRKSIDDMMSDFAKKEIGMEMFSSKMPENGRFNATGQRFKFLDDKIERNEAYVRKFVAGRFGSSAGGYWTTAADLQKFGDWIQRRCQHDKEFQRLIQTHGGEFYNAKSDAVEHSGLHADSAHFYTSLRNGTTITALSDQGNGAAPGLVNTILKQTTWFRCLALPEDQPPAVSSVQVQQPPHRVSSIVHQFNTAVGQLQPQLATTSPSSDVATSQDKSNKPKIQR